MGSRLSPSARVLVVALSLLLGNSVQEVCAEGREIIVSPSGPIRSLNVALAGASDGDRILVLEGTYRDSTIVVSRSVSIRGEGWPVLDGDGERQIMVVHANGVSISGLVFRNVASSFVDDRSALKVHQADDCLVAHNRFEDTFFGIYLSQSQGCRVIGNEIRASERRQTLSANGIHLWYSRDVLIRDNHVTGHRDGIYLQFVQDSRVVANVSEGNLRYGLHFMFSNDCEYQDNVFRRNDAGVAVMYSTRVVMRGNTFEHNWGSTSYGLLLKDITDSQITENVFHRNTVGVFAEGSSRLSVDRNQFTGNGWAVKVMGNCLDVAFEWNDFISNSFDVATNSRHHYSSFRRNYWDRYRGYDLDGDGVGDVPFRPVRLFAVLVEQNKQALILLRSFFAGLLDAAEAVIPALTPPTLVDHEPRIRRAL